MKKNIWWLLNRLGVMPLLTIWSFCDRKFVRWNDKSIPFLVLCVAVMVYGPLFIVCDVNAVFENVIYSRVSGITNAFSLRSICSEEIE